jgi:hypothetical protein
MRQRPSRSTLAALLLGAILLLPRLTGSAVSAAQPTPHRTAAVASVLPEPLARLWQALVQLVRGTSAPGATSTPASHVLPDAGCGLAPDGGCA